MIPFEIAWDAVEAVGAWVGGAATAGSLWLGFTILRREQKRREQEQAAQILCWVRRISGDRYDRSREEQEDPITFRYMVSVVNNSPQHIVNPSIKIHAYYSKGDFWLAHRRWPRHYRNLLWARAEAAQDHDIHLTFPEHEVLQPSEKLTVSVETPTEIELYWLTELSFFDARSTSWVKDLLTGEMYVTGSGRGFPEGLGRGGGYLLDK